MFGTLTEMTNDMMITNNSLVAHLWLTCGEAGAVAAHLKLYTKGLKARQNGLWVPNGAA